MRSPPSSLNIEFIYFNAGGGHKSAATALKGILQENRPDWGVTLVNLEDILHPIDPVHLVKKDLNAADAYNWLLKRDITFAAEPGLHLLQTMIAAASPLIKKLMREHWKRTRPDMVVSIIPNFNRPLFRALEKECPASPYVTLMTDIADYPPHFWQEDQDQYIICGSEKAYQQARKIYHRNNIYRASGMILKPPFYQATKADNPDAKQQARQEMGLDPQLPTALIMFGGMGSDISEKIVDRFARAKLEVQSIVMCGSNSHLFDRLYLKERCLPVGFTDQVPYFMRLSDFFIGKPGPGSLSEAVQMGLPVITRKDSWTLPQERYNADWIIENKLGVVVKNFKNIADAAQTLLADNKLAEFKKNAAAMNNRALFEIPEFLEDILKKEGKNQPKALPSLHR